MEQVARTGNIKNVCNIVAGLSGWNKSAGSRGSGLDLSGSEQGPVTGVCGHGNGRLGATEGEEFLEELVQYQFMQKGCAHRSTFIKIRAVM
jgi:hypothetical protein